MIHQTSRRYTSSLLGCFLASVVAGACASTEGDGDCPVGTEGCPCFVSTCDVGLVCVDDICESQAADDGGPSTSGDPGTSGGSTTSGDPGTSGTSDTSADSSASGDGDGDGDGGPCGPTHQSPGTAALGEACTSNDDCASGLCPMWSDVPPSAGVVCAPHPEGCATRVTGTLRDLFDFILPPIEGGTVGIVGFAEAVADPVGAARIVETGTAADATYDAVSPGGGDRPMAALGLTAVAELEGYAPSITPIAASGPGDLYGPGVDAHDAWAIEVGALEVFNNSLASSAGVPLAALPLGGEAGGAVGIVRSADNGDPVAGATVMSQMGSSSAAIVLYLDDSFGAFNTTATGSTGIFVVLQPGVGEVFDAFVGGQVVATQVAGSAANAVFIMPMITDG